MSPLMTPKNISLQADPLYCLLCLRSQSILESLWDSVIVTREVESIIQDETYRFFCGYIYDRIYVLRL